MLPINGVYSGKINKTISAHGRNGLGVDLKTKLRPR